MRPHTAGSPRHSGSATRLNTAAGSSRQSRGSPCWPHCRMTRNERSRSAAPRRRCARLPAPPHARGSRDSSNRRCRARGRGRMRLLPGPLAARRPPPAAGRHSAGARGRRISSPWPLNEQRHTSRRRRTVGAGKSRAGPGQADQKAQAVAPAIRMRRPADLPTRRTEAQSPRTLHCERRRPDGRPG